MFRSSASISGAKAKAYGRFFENILSVHCQKTGIKFEQIPSGCKWVGKTPIPMRTPFDFIAAKNGRAIVFDAKTLNNDAFSKSACTPHQIDSLYGFEVSGLTAGYIVWFRTIDSVVFFSASQLKQLKPRCSLKILDGVFLGRQNALNLEVLFCGR